MSTVVKVIFGVLLILLLLAVGGVVLQLLGAVAGVLARIVIGALAVLFFIWLINHLRVSR